MILRVLLLLCLLLSGCRDSSWSVSDSDAQLHLQSEEVSASELLEILNNTDDPDDTGILLGADRSSHWKVVRNDHLRRFPECAACGKSEKLYVHHIQPFHLKHDLELESSNLITFCYDHHLQTGHHGNWRDFNPNCVRDAAKIRESLNLPKLSRVAK